MSKRCSLQAQGRPFACHVLWPDNDHAWCATCRTMLGKAGPTFTQKHYEHMLVALAVEHADDATIETLCRIFQRDNPNFNKFKFVHGINAASAALLEKTR